MKREFWIKSIRLNVWHNTKLAFRRGKWHFTWKHFETVIVQLKKCNFHFHMMRGQKCGNKKASDFYLACRRSEEWNWRIIITPGNYFFNTLLKNLRDRHNMMSCRFFIVEYLEVWRPPDIQCHQLLLKIEITKNISKAR